VAAAKAKAAAGVVAAAWAAAAVAAWAAAAVAAWARALAVVWAWGQARAGSLTRRRPRTQCPLTREVVGPRRWRAATS